MTILVIAEHDQNALKRATYHTVTAAASMSSDVDLLVFNPQVSTEAAKISGIKHVLVVDEKNYAHQLAENVAPLVSELAKQYTHVLAPATTFGKNILPRAAALTDMAMISDVIKIISPDTFLRPIYAGNALATVQSHEAIQFLTVRSTGFAAATQNQSATAEIKALDILIPNTLSQFEGEEIHISARPELTAARIIVAGGRGLKSLENFKLLEKLADTLGAALGASRAAVDAGFAPNDYQVGQTGKVVAPDLYIAIGISGAIQHLAGMKDSKVIVAINNDPDAPIFQVADYGLVADLFTSLQELQLELDKR